MHSLSSFGKVDSNENLNYKNGNFFRSEWQMNTANKQPGDWCVRPSSSKKNCMVIVLLVRDPQSKNSPHFSPSVSYQCYPVKADVNLLETTAKKIGLLDKNYFGPGGRLELNVAYTTENRFAIEFEKNALKKLFSMKRVGDWTVSQSDNNIKILYKDAKKVRDVVCDEESIDLVLSECKLEKENYFGPNEVVFNERSRVDCNVIG